VELQGGEEPALDGYDLPADLATAELEAGDELELVRTEILAEMIGFCSEAASPARTRR